MTARRTELHAFLDQVHATYQRARYLGSDPVSAVHRFADPRDQEVVGYLAAGLAFGNVRAVLASVARALAPLGPHPARTLAALGPREAARAAEGFNHRWVFAPDLAGLYRMLGAALREAGGLEPLFAAGLRAAAPPADVRPAAAPSPADPPGDVRPGAAALVAGLRALAPPDVDLSRKGTAYFLPQAEGPGAAKRLHMFLRWMVRKDAVDLGLWRSATPAELLVPLDTHIAHLGQRLGLTRRRTPGLAMALDITAGLRQADPADPVKYDFALTRLGILRECPLRRDPARCAGCALLAACRL